MSCAVRTRALGMFAATSMTRLVASACLALRIASRRLSAFLLAVDVAAIAAAADQHLSVAARAQKESPSCICLSGFVTHTWTKSATGGILPRHTCSARCRARRRYETWQLRSAPCLSQSTDRSSRTQCVLATPKSRATRDGLWVCGQRKGVAHIPTGPTTTATSFNLMNSKTVNRTGRF